jgi:CheY-specific phosphatase CheX
VALLSTEAMTITPKVSMDLVAIRANGFRALGGSLGLVGTIQGVVVVDTTSRTALAGLGGSHLVQNHHEAADVGGMLTGRASFMFDTINGTFWGSIRIDFEAGCIKVGR